MALLYWGPSGKQPRVLARAAGIRSQARVHTPPPPGVGKILFSTVSHSMPVEDEYRHVYAVYSIVYEHASNMLSPLPPSNAHYGGAQFPPTLCMEAPCKFAWR